MLRRFATFYHLNTENSRHFRIKQNYFSQHREPSPVLKTLILDDPELYGEGMRVYVFTLDTLLAAELRAVVSAQIFAGETPVSCTLQYSADSPDS